MEEEAVETKDVEVLESTTLEDGLQDEEYRKELLKQPAVRANLVYQNYINTCERILSGKEKRNIRRRILRETLKGKYDYMFDEAAIARKEERSRKAFDSLNKS